MFPYRKFVTTDDIDYIVNYVKSQRPAHTSEKIRGIVNDLIDGIDKNIVCNKYITNWNTIKVVVDAGLDRGIILYPYTPDMYEMYIEFVIENCSRHIKELAEEISKLYDNIDADAIVAIWSLAESYKGRAYCIRKYTQSRALTKDIISHAPSSWDDTSDHLDSGYGYLTPKGITAIQRCIARCGIKTVKGCYL